MEQQQISDFYDEFSERQIQISVNERLISLYKRLLKLGLNNNSNIIELGCGVGAFTFLLSRKVKNGQIKAIDLSPKSIEIAKKRFQQKNIVFESGDVVKYSSKISPDFVTLMDVIEHIPLENHQELFNQIAGYCSEKTLVCINIPNPDFLIYTEKTDPKSLQIIDQPIFTKDLVHVVDNSGLELVMFEKYSIWTKHDYHFFVLRKKQDYQVVPLSEQRSFLEKLKHKVAFIYNQIKYKP